MNLTSLRYFVAVAEYSSFTKAAEHLYITQPTLSRQISLLEEEFGVQLFERSKRSLMLTGAGSTLLPEARDIIKRCDYITEIMKDSKKNLRGSLAIGYNGMIDNSLLNSTFKSAAEKYPNLDFSLHQCSFGELNHLLMTDRLDIISTPAVALDSLSNIEQVKLLDNKMQIAVSNKHPLSELSSVRLSMLADEKFIMMEQDVSPVTVGCALELCSLEGFVPNVTRQVRDGRTMLYLVGADQGVAFCFSQVIIPNPDDIKILNIEDCKMNFDIVLGYRKDNKNPAIPLFLSEIRSKSLYNRL